MHSGDTWRLGRRPALDGLRGLAIVLVIASHLTPGTGYGAGGPVGVTVFFVLSGFLITSLLLDERAKTAAVSLRAFYGRRARRLLPALGVFLAFTAATYAAAGRSLSGLLPVVFYFGNWVRAAGDMLPGMNHTWSLAVEEQFYLMWPLVLLAALRWGRVRTVFWIAVAGASSSAVLRVLLWDPASARHDRIWFGSDTNAVGLLAGCALAAWMSMRPAGGRNRPAVATGAVVVLIVAGGATSMLSYTVTAPLLATIGACVAIWLLCQSGAIGVFGNPVLRFVGRRSYGYYLWQAPMHVLGAALAPNFLASRVLIVALTVGVAEISWRLVERPVLRSGKRLDRDAVPVARPGRVQGVAADAVPSA